MTGDGELVAVFLPDPSPRWALVSHRVLFGDVAEEVIGYGPWGQVTYRDIYGREHQTHIRYMQIVRVGA